MKILAIETSCDDTGLTILEARGGVRNASFKILADSLAIQKIHSSYGGVFPMLAKNEHIKNLPILLRQTLKKARLERKKRPVDAIAVTYGPGLEPCLWTGITFAQNLSKKWKVPVIPVNHMKGHIVSVFGKGKGNFKIKKMKFPILSLLVSGGHTELVLSKSWTKHKILGKTLDDAAGEAFDKVARMLGFPYPGGPHISKLAEEERSKRKISFSLPRPMLHSNNLDFSFSGLKTAVLYLTKKIGKLDARTRAAIALEFENAVVETLVYKTKKAIEKYGIKILVVGGGVSANVHLQRELKKITNKKMKLYFPTKELARDNAIMIGMAGYLRYLIKANTKQKIKAVGNLKLS